MSSYSLPGITRIRIVRCADLGPHLMLHSICGCVVAIAAPYETVEFTGRPTLTWEGTKAHGDRQEKATLEFSTLRELPEGERLAFVVTCASGRQYLIGTREGRYPVITYTHSTGDPSGTAAARTYKITHTARKSVLVCVL